MSNDKAFAALNIGMIYLLVYLYHTIIIINFVLVFWKKAFGKFLNAFLFFVE